MTKEQTDQTLTHVGPSGEAHMVDVTAKPATLREAEARGRVMMRRETLDLIERNAAAKGDVLAVARVAGIMAAKRTSELIPLCHGVPLTGVDVAFQLDASGPAVEIVARARSEGKTGVEMEAMVAVSVAALTIYDMCKAVDRGAVIDQIRVTYKSGGKSGTYRAD